MGEMQMPVLVVIGTDFAFHTLQERFAPHVCGFWSGHVWLERLQVMKGAKRTVCIEAVEKGTGAYRRHVAIACSIKNLIKKCLSRYFFICIILRIRKRTLPLHVENRHSYGCYVIYICFY